MALSEPQTKPRLLRAAAELFAACGFHGTKVRDIAARAGVNLASGNYHYGSKKDLYVEVLRAQFAEIRQVLARRRAAPSPAELRRLSRPQLVEVLRARTEVMLDLLIGPPPGLHATLMQREMCDPSEALPVIVTEFIAPMMREVEQIITLLAPRLGRAAVERCARSMVGQALFYRFTMPAMLRFMRRRSYPRGLAHQLAAHITQFSLGGLQRLTNANRRSPRAH